MYDHTVWPVTLGISSLDLPVAALASNSNAFPINGATKVRFDISLTWAAAGDVTFKLQTRKFGDTDWKFMQLGEPVSGVTTYYDYQHVKPVTASKHWTEEVELTGGADEMRIFGLQDSTSTATSDAITIKATTLIEGVR